MLYLEKQMSEELPSRFPVGVAGALATLRHALADPLSAAGLKLEFLERRLSAAAPADPSLADRARGAKADLGVAGRLIDLLPRLASIAGEAPSEAALDDLCRTSGIRVEERGDECPRLLLRRLSTLDALRALAGFLRPPGPGGASPRAFTESSSDRVSLRIEAAGAPAEASPERLFHLPRGNEAAEDLFLARAGVESDGGRLELADRDGLLVALLSWPRPAPPATPGAAS
jgi:hypothetical protein